MVFRLINKIIMYYKKWKIYREKKLLEISKEINNLNYSTVFRRVLDNIVYGDSGDQNIKYLTETIGELREDKESKLNMQSNKCVNFIYSVLRLKLIKNNERIQKNKTRKNKRNIVRYWFWYKLY